MNRFWITFLSRNREFYRDRSAMGWAFLFPIFVIVGFSLIFDRDSGAQYKVGVVGQPAEQVAETYAGARYIAFVDMESKEAALDKLGHHAIDLVLDFTASPPAYHVSDTSPKGYVVERVLAGGGNEPIGGLDRLTVTGQEVPYLDWLFPGVLGMNVMFGALFGVGYVIVRYRKNGALKRLSVTPLTAFEFMTAHLASRMFIMVITTSMLYVGCAWLYDFHCEGSYFTLVTVFVLGCASMVGAGLFVATRTASEELAGGLLNFVSWPMMFLSEVWFSLEGAHPWVQRIAQALPLTHMVRASREVMNDGATMFDVADHVAAMAAMTFVFLGLGAMFFRWEKR